MIRRMHPNKGEIAELDADEDVTLKEVDAKVAMDADVHRRAYWGREVIKVVTVAKLMIEVVTTAATAITVVQVPKAGTPRRRMGVIIQDPEKAATTLVFVHSKVKSKDKDGTHQLFLSFITLLKSSDREALEMMWKLVQERFQSSEPNNFSDDFLLKTLQVMFENPNVEASIWRDQKGIYGLAKVKRWNIFESYGVHILILTTTQMILLVEKKYPLTRFTLEQMLNSVRQEVEEESETSRKYDKGLLLLVEELNAADSDDIIFGSTNKEQCIAFEMLMIEKFQMSSMGEHTFFLGLHVKQKMDGIFISQDKYVAKILNKFKFIEVKIASTPMKTQKPLLKDEDGEEVDVYMYRSMIGSLIYLTSLRHDIMFAVCACARYQVILKVSHLHAIKRIFRYLKGQPKLGFWYPKDSSFNLVAYTDSDYARESLDMNSTTEGCQYLGCKFDGKADEGFFIGHSLNSKAFRVFNSRKRIVEENLHIMFSKSTRNVVGSGLDWLFDIHALTRTMNYEPIIPGTQSNDFIDTKSSNDDGSKPLSDDGKKVDEDPRKENECNDQEKKDNVNITNNVNAFSSTVNTTGTNRVNVVGENISIELQFDPNMPALEDVSTFNFLRDDEDDDAKIEEEVYVCQPPGFEDPNFPYKVYKVEKALYGLHQAPKAWYETLSTYLLDNGFQKGKIDKTLIIKRHKGDILLMSSMGEHTFFLGLQVKQNMDGTFISQDKYVAKILKKFKFVELKTASTPMETQKPLLKDEDGEEVDVYMYRSMIGSLMYLTSLRPDIMFAVCACDRYQVIPKVSHRHAIKRNFRYIKGQPKLGFWYPKDSPFNLVAYTDSDYARENLDMKSTTEGCQYLGCRLISWQCKIQTMVVTSTI
nr:uncharacterized mitochondrial protein AtMg00810-like [Tanacetum cinerariifolium]